MQHAKHIADWASGLAVLLGVLNALPPIMTIISTGLAIVWYSLKIAQHLRKQRDSGDLE
jgi:hypothetical protein